MIDESNLVNMSEPVAETTVEEPKSNFDGLSNRDALKQAIDMHSEGKEPGELPTKSEVKQAVQEEVDAPPGFSKEGVEAWRRKDIGAIQKEFRRIHDARTVEVSRAQTAERRAREEAEREKAQVRPIRELAEKVRNYLSVRGEEEIPDEVKIAQALQLVSEMKKRDGTAIKAELRKLGIDLDRASETTAALPPEVSEKLSSLQQVADEYKRDKEEQHFRSTVQTFDTIFKNLTSQKTRTGETVFPDLLDNSEPGIEFARELGSLTRDERFQAGVLRRFPDATLEVVVREAYKYLGGRVSGESSRVSPQQNQNHLQRSRRASAASPGRSTPRVNDSNLNGKLSSRAALAKALEMHRGH
jgi:hypothetical protein